MEKIKFGIIPFMQGDEKSDAETILAISVAYFNAGMSLNEAIEDDVSYTFPSIVNLAFSIELLLKFFVVKNSLDRKEYLRKNGVFGHELKNLWDKLNSEDQNLVYAFLDNEGSEPYGNNEIIRLNKDKFDAHMQSIGRKPFVDWRYIHEKDNELHAIPFYDAYTVAISLIKAARYKIGIKVD